MTNDGVLFHSCQSCIWMHIDQFSLCVCMYDKYVCTGMGKHSGSAGLVLSYMVVTDIKVTITNRGLCEI